MIYLKSIKEGSMLELHHPVQQPLATCGYLHFVRLTRTKSKTKKDLVLQSHEPHFMCSIVTLCSTILDSTFPPSQKVMLNSPMPERKDKCEVSRARVCRALWHSTVKVMESPHDELQS